MEKAKKSNTLPMWCHLSVFAGFIIPMGNFLGPLFIWLWKKDENELVDDQGKESLNFQISILLYSIVAGILTLVFIGFILLIAIALFAAIQVIIAAISADKGEKFRYPFCIRVIK